MAEMTTHELLGRKTEQHENLLIEYRRLLEIVKQVAAGEIAGDRVSVNVDAMTWAVGPVKSDEPSSS